MKKIVILLIALSVTCNVTISQSFLSVFGKAGGQLIQDLSDEREFRAIGKAIETASDRTFEIEKINAINKKEIIIRTNPDNTTTLIPKEGYKWKNPNDINDYNIEQISENDKKEYSSALDLLKEAFDYYDRGDLGRALIYCNESLEKEPSQAGYLLRSLLYSHDNNMLRQALSDLGSILNYDIDNELYSFLYLFKAHLIMLMGDYTKALVTCNEAISTLDLTTDARSLLLTTRGAARFSMKEYDLAIMDHDEALRINPENTDAYMNRGNCKRFLNDFSGANSDYTKAIQIFNSQELSTDNKSGLSIAYLKRSVIKSDQLDYRSAIEDINNSIKLDETNATAYALRGLYKFKMGFIDSSCADWNIAKSLGYTDVEKLEEYEKYCK